MNITKINKNEPPTLYIRQVSLNALPAYVRGRYQQENEKRNFNHINTTTPYWM